MSLRALVLICFFLSGATGLLYEVLWTRLFGGTIGNTHFSITVVVSMFMGGLALGSWLGGKVADRSRNPLRLYGILNLTGALLCLAVLPAVEWARPLFGFLYRFHDGNPDAPVLLATRILFSALLILAPTTCMGATLPVLARFFATRLGSVGFTVGRLYSINTFGAVVGVFLAGFWSIEHLGVHGTTFLAVGIDVAVGLLVIAVSRAAPRPDDGVSPDPKTAEALPGRSPETPSPPAPADRLPPAVRRAVLAFGVAGFANMLLQIAWTKAIVQTIGNSTYAFSLIVTLFILGIGIGGGAMTLIVDRLRNPSLALGLVIATTGLLVTSTVPLLGEFPVHGARLFDRFHPPEYTRFLWIKVGMVAVVILPTTILMGMVFPLVGRIRTLAIERVGSAVGSAYFANTLGSILGTLIGGFVFVPVLGRIYWTLYLGGGISVLIGLWLLVSSSASRSRRVRVAWAVAIIALALGPGYLLRPHGVLGSTSHRWHPALISRGAYAYFRGAYWKNRRLGEVRPAAETIERILAGNEVVWYREGIHAPVAVIRNPTRGTALRISGKVEASLAPGGGYNRDLPHQIMAGHLGMLLHSDPQRVMTLGLGGGVTLGTLTLYPVERVDSLEISPEVVEAARRFFASANRGALGDSPRVPVRNIVGDGRNHLQYTTSRYDVITSVPSNPWIAGIGNLFTTEFFRLCREHLEPGGIVCNWIHKINMRTEDMRTVVRTFLEVFGEHAQLWDLGFDCLLIGSDRPVLLDLDRFAALLGQSEIREDLASLGITDAATLLRHYQWDTSAMETFAGTGPLNTDALPVLEFSCPRGLYGHRFDSYEALARGERSPLAADWIRGERPSDLERAAALRRALQELQGATTIVDQFQTLRSEMESDPEGGREGSAPRLTPREQRQLVEQSEELVRRFDAIRAILAEHPDPWLSERSLVQARAAFGRRSRNLDSALLAHFNSLAAGQKDPAAKVVLLERGLPYAGAGSVLPLELAQLYMTLRAYARGVEKLAPLSARHPDDPRLLQAVALLRAAGGDSAAAEPMLRRALELATDRRLKSEILNNLAFALKLRGDTAGAVRRLEEALRWYPENRSARLQLEQLRE